MRDIVLANNIRTRCSVFKEQACLTRARRVIGDRNYILPHESIALQLSTFSIPASIRTTTASLSSPPGLSRAGVIIYHDKSQGRNRDLSPVRPHHYALPL
jgi:hypothetical protein